MSNPMSMARSRRVAVIEDMVGAVERLVEIRLVEDRLNELYAEGLIRGSIHTCQGQEAVAVAAATASRLGDFASATYRGHGVALAWGATPFSVIAEVLGRSGGSAGGYGGSMHLVQADVGLLPTNAIVGAGLPIAVGAAAAAVARGSDAVSFAFFGDGSSNIGAFHESLNLAAVWNLPVVFVCENNLYGEYSPLALTTSVPDIATRALSYGMAGSIVDGQDYFALTAAFRAAVDRARGGRGPSLIEAKTYRYHGHSKSDPASYRPVGELQRWQERDPIELMRARLEAEGAMSAEDFDILWADVSRRVDAEIQRALGSPAPDPAGIYDHVCAS